MSGAIHVLKIVSIPFFQVGILFIVTSAAWFLITGESTDFKKQVLNFVTDGLYYFIITTLALNVLFNFSEILHEPYRAILFSSTSSWIALILVSFYLVYREGTKNYSVSLKKEKYIDHTLNFLLLLGLANHLFYYYKYRNLSSVLFVLLYFGLYLLKDKQSYSQRNEATLVLLALLHGLIMASFSSVIIYYQIVFYPYQMISLLLIASILVYYFRRGFSSKQK